jgi:hypothetical protein
VQLVLLSLTATAGAQTIGDYSRAQAAALERNMLQAIGRPLNSADGAHADLPSSSSQLRGATPAPATSPANGEPSARQVAPDLVVTGTFVSEVRTVVEVVVGGTSYWLGEGDAIPRTPWILRRIAPDRVELERRATGRSRAPGHGVATTRTLHLSPVH